jgi:hypothetical protein
MHPQTYCSDEQKAIVESPERRIIINGCAGSRKTDSLCRLAGRYFLEGKNILLVTLVGSVTNEIRERLQVYLGVTFDKIGNHFITTDGRGTTIEIANYDAMLHKQLSFHRDPYIYRNGDCFDEKAVIFYEKYASKGLHNGFILQNDAVADVVIVDEFQDLHPLKARILTTVVKNNGKMYAVAAGDYVQSIFDHAFEESDADGATVHPMNIWRRELDAVNYPMTRCFRCPRAHVDLVNTLMEPFHAAYDVTPMIPTNDDVQHRPVLFTCPPSSRNHGADVVAKQVTRCIVELFKLDPSLTPGDVAIVMAKSNRNSVFHQIERRLSAVYAGMGFQDVIKIFETKVGGQVFPIKWEKATGKTVMLSIHGDKGRGHPVVFFLGLTEGTVPSKNRLFTDRELIDVSLMNVALTRSTRWLFVGFTREWPSRYLRNAASRLPDVAVLSWEADTYVGTPFQPACDALNACYSNHLNEADRAPCFDNPNYIERRVCAPQKLVAEIKNDVAHMYEHPKQIVPLYPWSAVKATRFGRPITTASIPEEQAGIFGVMGELMFQRYYCVTRHNNTARATTDAPSPFRIVRDEFGFLLDPSLVLFTANEQLLNLVQDEMLNLQVRGGLSNIMFVGTWNRIISENRNRMSARLYAAIEDVLKRGRPVVVLPQSLRDVEEDVRTFLDTDVPNEHIPSRIFWNVAIVYMALYEQVRTPSLARRLNRFTADLCTLHHNICRFYETIAGVDVTFHEQYKLMAVEHDSGVLEDMGLLDSGPVSYGLRGVSDFESGTDIYEVKCPISQKYTNTWVLQPLMYACLNTRNDNVIKHVHVVDLTNGVHYSFEDIDRINRRSVLRRVLSKLKFRDEHVKTLCGQVAVHSVAT